MAIARHISCNRVYLVDEKADNRYSVAGSVRFRFLGQLINGFPGQTDSVMIQAQVFKADRPKRMESIFPHVP